MDAIVFKHQGEENPYRGNDACCALCEQRQEIAVDLMWSFSFTRNDHVSLWVYNNCEEVNLIIYNAFAL